MKHSLLTVYGRLLGKVAHYDGPERRRAERRAQRDRRSGTLLTREPDRLGRRSGKDRRAEF